MDRIISLLVLCTLFFSNGSAVAHTKSVPITATSWVVADGTGRIIEKEKSTEQRSIASITKLMTVMVVLDAKQDLTERIGPYTRQELIQLALVKSDNKAAATLCDHYPGGKDKCVYAMNFKAKELGMNDSQYTEATGLSVFNISTAEDLIKQIKAASQYPEIVEASKMSQVKIKQKKKWLIFHNTNPIIGKKYDFVVSKTGYIKASGGCIAMMVNTEIGQRIVVILGSKNTHTRIPEAEFIAKRY